MGTQKNHLIETFFEHPKHMHKLIDKIIIAILLSKTWLSGPMMKVLVRLGKGNSKNRTITCVWISLLIKNVNLLFKIFVKCI